MTTPMTISQARTLLGLESTIRADGEVLKTSYRQAARNAHPDHGGDAGDMALVNEAYRLLQEHPEPDRYQSTATLDGQPLDGARRERPVWTRQHTQAADALNLDELLDDLRTIVEPRASAARPRIRHMGSMDVEVSNLPPGGRVLVSMQRALVLDAEGNRVDCDMELVSAEESMEILEEYRRALGG